MRDESEWVADQFAAGVRDCTPAPVRHAARVLYAPISRDPEAARRCASVLSAAELERAARFVTEEGRAHFQQRRAFRRYCGAVALGSKRPLSRIVFAETEKGHPYLPEVPDLWFSFSSCPHGWLGGWSSTHAIGVDIEDEARSLEATELARRYFSDAEARAVEGADDAARTRVFLQLWSLKEAALKSIGEGLPLGLAAFQFELAPDLRVVHAPRNHGGPGRFQAHLLKGAGSCAALIVREGHSSPQ
jgi:4'-phosphopantetheinyl transferase